ncbi:MAG: glycosyltransferase family 2 protein [Actinobacteria bacterium]|nr:glycosyltransferase family 2 protein [Actinomycetota bacterium]MBW3648949.1 glycosyltransferase family 2 protein [Actinomycetota bacterium]
MSGPVLPNGKGCPESDGDAPATATVPPRPLVTICVLNHNYDRFLADAIDSALAQDYEHVEVVVVDDGSTDRSQEVIAGYGDHLRALCKENGGQGSAVNAGFVAARGEVVMFLDADDILLPGIAGAVAEAFERQPSLAKVQFRMALADAAGTPLGLLVPPRPGALPSGDLRHHVVRFRNYAWQPTSANAHPAWVLDQLLPLPEARYPTHCDAYLAELAPLFGPVRSLDEVGVRYRLHGTNDFAGRRVTPEWIRMKLDQVCANHSRFHALAGRLGVEGSSADPRTALDAAFLTFRLASLKLDRPGHLLASDRARTLVGRGVEAVLRHPHLSLKDRLKRVTWFVVVGASPPPLARRLIEAYIPDGPVRPRWDRAVRGSARSRLGSLLGSGGSPPRRHGLDRPPRGADR